MKNIDIEFKFQERGHSTFEDMPIVSASREVYEFIRETEDAFVLEHILPFCEEVLQRKISKEELIKKLTNTSYWHTGTPPAIGDYLVFDTEEYFCVDAYYPFDGTEEYGSKLAYKGWQYCKHVEYWMPIPKLPYMENEDKTK